MGFNKHPIPPYTVSTYQELFHCMNTTFLVEADSQTCIGVHFDAAHCCLVIFCTPCPYFPILHPALFSSPATPYLSQPLPLLSLLSRPPTPYFTTTVSSFPLLLHLSELRGGSWQVTRVVKPDELGRPDESLREQMRKLELSPQEGEDTLTHSSRTHKTHSLL